MKNFLQYSIGAFLLMSGAGLFVFSIHPAYGEQENRTQINDAEGDVQIRYVNIDTINANYLPYVELAASASGDLEEQMAAYQKNAETLQNRYAKLQDQVNMGTISAEAASKEEEAINNGIDQLKLQETQLSVIEANAMAKNDSISENIANFFYTYSRANGIDFVFMYGTGMPIIYANDKLDVTNQVLTELNAAYHDSKKPKDKKK